jgi:hypothetical protein
MNIAQFLNGRLLSMGHSQTVEEISYSYGDRELVLGTTEKCDVFDNHYAILAVPVKAWFSFSRNNTEIVHYLKNFKKPLYLYLSREGAQYFLEKKVPYIFSENQSRASASWIEIKTNRINNHKIQITL